MKTVNLTQGFVAHVDDHDFERVEGLKWHLVRMGTAKRPILYAARNVTIGKNKGRLMLMHRFIMGAEKGEVVDHIDHDGLNNRRSNLRLCKQADNMKNARSGTNRTGFRGVHQASVNSFRASICVNRKAQHLGSFPTAEAAARAYDAAAIIHFGQFAQSNFPA